MAGVSRIVPGQVCGDLTVLARAGTRGMHAMWQCRCVCGTEAALDSRSMARGRLFSGCGCPGRTKALGRNATWAADPAAAPPPPPPKRRKPHVVPLHTMIRIGRELGLSPEQAMDADRLSRAARRDDPSHPGYAEEGRRLRTLGHGMTAP
jgi:hypothetical protein